MIPRPPRRVRKKLERVFSFLATHAPSAYETLSSSAVIGVPFSIYVESEGDVSTFMSALVGWPEKDGQPFPDDTEEAVWMCCPLVFVRDVVVLRETVEMLALNFYHEALHLKEWPEIYYRICVLGEDERQVMREWESRVHRKVAVFATIHDLLQLLVRADAVELEMKKEDVAERRVVSNLVLTAFAMGYVAEHKSFFPVRPCPPGVAEARKALLERLYGLQGKQNALDFSRAALKMGAKLRVSWVWLP